MPLVHKAFRTLSDRIEVLADNASTMEDIAELNDLSTFWIKQIVYHAAVEDEVMTGPLKNGQLSRDNETEHTELAGKAGERARFIARGNSAGLEESVRAAAFTLEEGQHKELEERSHEV